jgi:Domain of unknown function (DUF4304)
MARSVLDEAFNKVVMATGDRLKPLGFVRGGSILRVINQNNCGIVEFQRSRKSSRERLFFTVNLGVVCGELLDSTSCHPEKAKSVDAHVRLRIGMLLPDRPDKWWEISESTDLDSLATEVSEIIFKVAVPYIQHYMRTSVIADLWKSGQSPGLTDRQRVMLLDKLNARYKGGVE